MKRTPAELVGNAPLVQERTELVEQTDELLERGAGLFDLVRSYCPDRVKQMNIIARVGGPPTQRVVDGKLVSELSPLPEQPEQFRLPAVVVPARNFTNPTTSETVQRRAAVNLSVRYDWGQQSGVKFGLPLPSPRPDQIQFEAAPISLEGPRYEEAHETLPVETVSGDFVQVYTGEIWKSREFPYSQIFPFHSPREERKDWGAFVEYPPEALSQEMIDFHRASAEWIIRQLDVVQQALLDPTLNPRR